LKRMEMKISDIFYSIQGEGFFVGTPTIFIRFYGCNLDCPFCDEPSSIEKTMNENQILQKLKKYPCKIVTLTGGEPTLSNLNKFIDLLHQNGYEVRVETNGYNIENVKNADWIACSPKFKEKILHNKINEYKILVSKEEDIQEALFYTKYCNYVYIQPINYYETINEKNLLLCINSVLKHPKLRLSLQIQKLIGVK